jgi:hypothetical protein
MLRKFSLPAKVTFLLSLVVFVVVFAVTLVINKISADSIANDLKERSQKAANEIAKELGENPQLPKTDDLEDTILNALEINRSITEISVFKMNEIEPEFAATSARANQIPVTDEIRTSIRTGKPSAHLVPNDQERFWNIVVPIYHRAPKIKQSKVLGAVTVLTSLRQADRAESSDCPHLRSGSDSVVNHFVERAVPLHRSQPGQENPRSDGESRNRGSQSRGSSQLFGRTGNDCRQLQSYAAPDPRSHRGTHQLD